VTPTHAPASPDPAGCWTCPGCGADRAADDAFCGRCGARRLSPAAGGSVAAPGHGSSVRRALVLNGVVVGAVLLAVALGANGGPASISFEPATWRCDGTPRVWAASIPERATELRVEWRLGGPEGELVGSTTTTRLALEAFAGADGTLRVPASGSTQPECALAPGTYTMAIRDVAGNALLATGDVVLAEPSP
jgi:hypothetical protein